MKLMAEEHFETVILHSYLNGLSPETVDNIKINIYSTAFPTKVYEHQLGKVDPHAGSTLNEILGLTTQEMDRCIRDVESYIAIHIYKGDQLRVTILFKKFDKNIFIALGNILTENISNERTYHSGADILSMEIKPTEHDTRSKKDGLRVYIPHGQFDWEYRYNDHVSGSYSLLSTLDRFKMNVLISLEETMDSGIMDRDLPEKIIFQQLTTGLEHPIEFEIIGNKIPSDIDHDIIHTLHFDLAESLILNLTMEVDPIGPEYHQGLFDQAERDEELWRVTHG